MWILWTLPPSHLQSFDVECVRLRDTRKSQSSNVDGRCDGDEMSIRDQKGRTRPLDRVKEDVSQEYFPCRNKLIYLWHIVSGKRMSWVGKVDNTASVSVGWSLSKIQNPPRYTQTKNYYEISWRTINFCCIDGLVYVWLSCIDCGCIESATSLRCDSNPVPQTNLGLTSLYSLFSYWMDRTCGLTTHRYDFCI